METIILTGASGFVGTDLIRELGDDYEIAALGRTFKHKPSHSRVHCVEGDLLSMPPDKVLSVLRDRKADVFIHAAGQAHIAQTGDAGQLFKRNNVEATEAALRLAVAAGVRKFILISSAVVYNDDDSDMYEQSKREAESLVKERCGQYGIACVIIRPVMVYGENEPSGYFSNFAKQLGKGLYLMPNSGRKPKYMVYIRNVSFIVRETISTDLFDNGVVVARDAETLELRQICAAVMERTGTNCKLIPIPSFVIKSVIVGIHFIQLFGVLRRVKVRSIRNLNTRLYYPISESNGQLLEQLPFTVQEGITRTLASL